MFPWPELKSPMNKERSIRRAVRGCAETGLAMGGQRFREQTPNKNLLTTAQAGGDRHAAKLSRIVS